jgi:hypothetical protein
MQISHQLTRCVRSSAGSLSRESTRKRVLCRPAVSVRANVIQRCGQCGRCPLYTVPRSPCPDGACVLSPSLVTQRVMAEAVHLATSSSIKRRRERTAPVGRCTAHLPILSTHRCAWPELPSLLARFCSPAFLLPVPPCQPSSLSGEVSERALMLV